MKRKSLGVTLAGLIFLRLFASYSPCDNRVIFPVTGQAVVDPYEDKFRRISLGMIENEVRGLFPKERPSAGFSGIGDCTRLFYRRSGIRIELSDGHVSYFQRVPADK